MAPTTSRTYDRRWYERKLVDRHGRPRRFRGGPLRRYSLELDAFYHGVPLVNRVNRDLAGIQAVILVLAMLGGRLADYPPVPEPLDLDTREWVRWLHMVWEAESLIGSGDPSTAINFKLDVLRALDELPDSQLSAFVAYMDGYSLDEIRRLCSRLPEKPWSEQTAERSVRRASTETRNRCAVDTPGAKKRQPRECRPLAVIHSVEARIQAIRWEQARRVHQEAA